MMEKEEKRLPEWLQRLWELNPSIARQAEKHIDSLIAKPPIGVKEVMNDKKIWQLYCKIQGWDENGMYGQEKFLIWKEGFKEALSLPSVNNDAVDWDKVNDEIADLLFDSNGTSSGTIYVVKYIKEKFKLK